MHRPVWSQVNIADDSVGDFKEMADDARNEEGDIRRR